MALTGRPVAAAADAAAPASPAAAAGAAPSAAAAAALGGAAAAASPSSGFIYSLSSDAPSNQVIKSSRSTKTRFNTCSLFPFCFSASFNTCADSIYSGIATSFFCHAKKILRRSTGESSFAAETNRVGVFSGIVRGTG